jgi:hypothetical protein
MLASISMSRGYCNDWHDHHGAGIYPNSRLSIDIVELRERILQSGLSIIPELGDE